MWIFAQHNAFRKFISTSIISIAAFYYRSLSAGMSMICCCDFRGNKELTTSTHRRHLQDPGLSLK